MLIECLNGMIRVSPKRKKRLKNLGGAIGAGLDEGIKRNKSSLRISLSRDFAKEITG